MQTGQPKRRTSVKVPGKPTDEEFIIAWQMSDSREDVERITGLDKRQIASKSAYLRSKGVPLKLFARTNIEALNNLARRALE